MELGQRVKYEDIACRGLGHVRAINPYNKAIALVEVDEKDSGHAGFSLDDKSACGYSLTGDAGNLRPFWIKELKAL